MHSEPSGRRAVTYDQHNQDRVLAPEVVRSRPSCLTPREIDVATWPGPDGDQPLVSAGTGASHSNLRRVSRLKWGVPLADAPGMRSPVRIPIVVYAAGAALGAIGTPVLAMAAWRTFVWRTPGSPDTVASLEELAALAALLGLLVAGQLVVLVQHRREVIDAIAVGDAGKLEAAARRALGSVRLAAVVGALALVVYLSFITVSQGLVAPPDFDWVAFGLALTLAAGPVLAALVAPAWFIRLADAAPTNLATAIRLVSVGTLVAVAALGAALLGATAGFAGAQAACQPGGSTALCGAANGSIGDVVGLIGPAVVLPCLAVADRALRALWTITTSAT